MSYKYNPISAEFDLFNIGSGTILGTVGTTASLGIPIPYGSGIANTITSSPFFQIYNIGTITKVFLSNTSTVQQQGFVLEENGTYSGFSRYGSGYTTQTFPNTNVLLQGTTSLETHNNLSPLHITGRPITNAIGATLTNIGTRLDAIGFRIGTSADIGTSNTYIFQISNGAFYNESGNNSYISIGNTSATNIPLIVTSREAISTSYNTDYDPNIVSARTIPDSIITNSHGFVEATVFKSTTGNLANNAFTDNGILTDPTGSAGNYNHHASYQSQVKLNNTGTTGNLYFCADAPTVNSGILTNRYGFYFYDGVGTGTITNQYGLYVPTLSKGSTTNEAIHVVSNPSYFGGAIKMVSTSGSANVVAPATEWYHATTIKTSWIADKIINNTSELKFNVSLYNFTGYKEMITIRGDDNNTNSDYCIINASKQAFYNVTPVSRATTGGSASTFVANTSGIANDTTTFDGYTIGQIVKALRDLGILT